MLGSHHQIVARVAVLSLETKAMMCGTASAAGIATLIKVLIIAANRHKIDVRLRTEFKCKVMFACAKLNVVRYVSINFRWHSVNFINLFKEHLTSEVFCHLNHVDLVAVSDKQLH